MRPAISVRFVVPVAPYTSAMPYSRNAVENAPSRKYFSAPSAERSLRRLMPASTYTEIDISSMPRNTIIRSRAAASSIMPDVASSTSTCDSAVGDPRAHVVVHAQRDREHRPEQDDDVDHPAEVVDGDRARARPDSARPSRSTGRIVIAGEQDAGDADVALMRVAVRAPRGDDEQNHRAAHEDEVRHEREHQLRRNREVESRASPARLRDLLLRP